MRFHNGPRQNNTHTIRNPEQQQLFNPHNNYTHNHYPQPSSTEASPAYAQLLKENHELRTHNRHLSEIVEKEYKPLRLQYEKLKEEHEDREFLISQLEWKVKELAKDLKNKKYTNR